MQTARKVRSKLALVLAPRPANREAKSVTWYGYRQPQVRTSYGAKHVSGLSLRRTTHSGRGPPHATPSHFDPGCRLARSVDASAVLGDHALQPSPPALGKQAFAFRRARLPPSSSA